LAGQNEGKEKKEKITEKVKLCGGFEKCRAASTCQRRLSLDDNRPPPKNKIQKSLFRLLSFWHRVGWKRKSSAAVYHEDISQDD
jgi:hypothetical protein